MDKDFSNLYEFAFRGTPEGYSNMIEYLAGIAEKELWDFGGEEKNYILKKYIFGTFRQCYNQNKILYTPDNEACCFNTGLLTQNGDDILAFFLKNQKPDSQPWFFKGFKEKSDRDIMRLFTEIPQLATYTDNYEEFYFNPNYEILTNTDHILDDNWERIQSAIPLSKNVVKTLLIGVVEEAKMKIRRNLRLVVPQFYDNKIMYLVPLRIPVDDDNYVTMALAVEKTSSDRYRANTIFTKETAYEKARLLMKPESNWLIEK